MRISVMLAVAGICVSTAAQATTVANGSFDLTSDASKGVNFKTDLNDLANGKSRPSWDVFKTLSGWHSTGAGVEVQTNRTLSQIDAHSGPLYLELDSNKNSGIFQDLALTGGQYELTFYYSPRIKNKPETNGIAYSVGDVSGSVTGPVNGTPYGAWTKVSQVFKVDANGAPIRLAFGATGRNDSLGGLIDTVSIAAIPVPAPFLMLGAGVVGLAGFGARKRSGKAGA